MAENYYKRTWERATNIKNKTGLPSPDALEQAIKELYPLESDQKDAREGFNREYSAIVMNNYGIITSTLYSDVTTYLSAHEGSTFMDAKVAWEEKNKGTLNGYSNLKLEPSYDFDSIYKNAELKDARNKAYAVTNFLKQLARIEPYPSPYGVVYKEEFTSYYWMPYEFSGSIKRYGLQWFLEKYPDLCYAITAGKMEVFKKEEYNPQNIERTDYMLHEDIITCKKIITNFLSFYDAIKTMKFTRLLRAIDTNKTQKKEPIFEKWSETKIDELRKFIKVLTSTSVGGYRRKRSGRKQSGRKRSSKKRSSHKRSNQKSRKARKTRRN